MNSVSFAEPLWAEKVERVAYDAPLAARETCDLLIVGGGFMGLSAARYAAHAGLNVRVVDAGRIGEGASGLNGGQVIPGLKFNPDWILQHFGEDHGARLNAFAETTADVLFDTIETERLNVPYERSGWIQACHTETALASAAERHKQWAARGANVAMLDATEVNRIVGTDNYTGGFYDKRAGVVQPLALTLELARIAKEAGVEITENTSCTRLSKRDGGWVAQTSKDAEITASNVILATNAYTDGLIPGLAQTLVPLHSFQVATPVLPEDLQRQILPGRQAVSDSRRIVIYYRKSPDGRMVLGGRGRMSTPRGPKDWAHLEHGLTRIFPALENTPIEKRWFGRVAMTADGLPHIHEPEKGLVTIVGCQGRGVAMMTAIGRHFIDYIMSGDAKALPFPISPVRPIPFHAFRQVGVAATIAWYRMLDTVER